MLGGLGLGLIPGVPEMTLEPKLVLVVFLPPPLYVSAFFASLRDLGPPTTAGSQTAL